MSGTTPEPDAGIHCDPAWLRLIADALPALIAYVDDTERYRFANRLHECWFGVSADDLPGEPFGGLFEPGLRARLAPQVAAVLSGRRVESEFELPISGADHRYVKATFVPHRGRDGRVRGFFLLGLDFTEHRQTQAALTQAMKMEAIGQLTGGIAHDFNNLLTIIMGNLALLEPDLEDRPALLECVHTALSAAQRGADLTGRLLAYSRRQALRPRVVELPRLMDDVCAFLGRTLGEAIRIDTRLAPEVWPAMADLNQLTSALLNLAINARDAMPDGGVLRITADNRVLDAAFCARQPGLEPGDYVHLKVRDTGVGMSVQDRERAFEPFFTTKQPGAGTGLGLSMVYGFARQSGGHVALGSEPGQGTTVDLYLPRARSELPSPTPAPSLGTPPVRSAMVLLVEDDPDLRVFVARVLREARGHRVVEAADGATAAALLADTRGMDLLLTDLVMPGGMGGRELIDRARRTGLRVLCMSGYVAQAGPADTLDCPLLPKPFTAAALLRAVDRSLASQATQTPDS